ncbi:MAG: RAD55 family ATPase [Candidatus Micrarchaeia archaeon]
MPMPPALPPMGAVPKIPLPSGELLETGIQGFDALIGGGLRPSSNVLLLGPPGIEKFVFGLQFAWQAFAKKQPVIYITTDLAPLEIENKGSEFGWRFFSYTNRGLSFIDCYSWTLGTPPADRKDIQVPGPSALNDLSIGVTQAIQEHYKPQQKSRVIIQSVSTLLLYNPPEVVFRFTQITGARLKSVEATTLWHLEAGMHDDKTVTTLKHLMDGVIEMKQEGGKNFLQAPLHGLKEWREFVVTPQGIALV